MDWTVPGVSHIGMIEKEHALTSFDRNLAMCRLWANRIGGIRRQPVRTAWHYLALK
jgi:hypothetical protein